MNQDSRLARSSAAAQTEGKVRKMGSKTRKAEITLTPFLTAGLFLPVQATGRTGQPRISQRGQPQPKADDFGLAHQIGQVGGLAVLADGRLYKHTGYRIKLRASDVKRINRLLLATF